MRFEPGYLFGMALQTVPEPRKIAREVQALRFSRAALWQVFILFAVLSTAMGISFSIVFPPSEELLQQVQSNPFLQASTNPFIAGLTESCLLVISIFMIYWVGALFGGTGRFDQAILTVLWLQYIMFIVTLVVFFLAFFAAPLAILVYALGAVLSFWILSNFITEMHGFRSAGLVFAMILLTIFATLIGLSIIVAVIGFAIPSAGA